MWREANNSSATYFILQQLESGMSSWKNGESIEKDTGESIHLVTKPFAVFQSDKLTRVNICIKN